MSISNVDRALLRYPNCLVRITGRDQTQVAREKANVINNVAKLMGLRIIFSQAAYGTLTEANTVLAVILSSIDLQKCRSARDAVKLINEHRTDALGALFTAGAADIQQPLPEEYFLTKLAVPTARYKYVLEVKLRQPARQVPERS